LDCLDSREAGISFYDGPCGFASYFGLNWEFIIFGKRKKYLGSGVFCRVGRATRNTIFFLLGLNNNQGALFYKVFLMVGAQIKLT
jgi:hypothetical protein